ncbi:hypothetical protein P153DRAFT_296118 [Dothidotthia symphoricarpi CBS 119687]|uniref:Mid2 domain-containing protein n=1 Tax=Dothidotthia symphoricarpi CBS 119687 TaxID=1392245 RepID=A0A6A6A7W3_9PLEO|nr:uncharacterized protein P153DRAFT_296118 [Dothidotthia symphoricarpi CBS 119687]KAF2127164.1 hypothetical protein P153DRAFT_296118 [Dothidotthia symphoricarpi CBS 119687]
MTSRAAQHAWSTAWQTAPPSACATLRNNAGIVDWGKTCVFPEDGGPTINPVNTACLPWAASSTNAQAFFSPATACPTSWSAVATQTVGTDWIDGETALQCCPMGFDADGSNCRPASTGTFLVVECGEADAEENEYRTYSGAAWPARATVSIAALQLRFQASDVGSVSATATGSSTSGTSSVPTSTGNSGTGQTEGGLSTGIKIAIGVIVPVVFLIGALAAFLLWRRKTQHKAAGLRAARLADEKHDSPPRSLDLASTHPYSASKTLPGPVVDPGIAVAGVRNHGIQHETPEWNHEMDATEAERQRLIAVDPAPRQYAAYQPPPGEMDAGGSQTVPSELGGVARVARKPIAPVEIDSQPWRAELDGGR